MNISRRTLLLCGCILAVTSITGCLTSSLYEDKTKRYQETIASVFVSKDEKNIVVIGEYYHYIFDAPKPVMDTLNGSFQKSVKATFQNFRLDSNNTITGEYMLRMNANSDQSHRQAALKAGYNSLPDNTLVYRGKLKGKRYGDGGLQLPVTKKQLNNFYRISITVPDNTLMKKVLLTPITVAADGVLFIAASPLIAMVFIASEGNLDLR